MEAVSGQISPDFETKRFNTPNGDRMVYIVTFNPISTSPGNALMVPVPKLYEGVVLVPGSFALKFNVTVSGHANNYFVNNMARALVDRLTVKTLYGTDHYDLFKLYEDLFLTENERASMLRQGIQTVDLSKIRCNAGDKKKSGVAKENKLNMENLW